MRHPFVHEWFDATAQRSAGRIAIETQGRSISYGELFRRSNALAARLVEAGASSGDVVGIFTADRPSLVTSILAILKAGCAFMPLPPHLPAPTLAAMLEVSEAAWTIVEAPSYDRFEQISNSIGERFEAVSPGDLTIAASPKARRAGTTARPRLSEPDDLAYIFFTSGSTGRPKAIAGRLRAIDHFIRWEIETFRLNADVRVSQLISPAFDACLRDIFVPLCAGGTLCAPGDDDLVLDPERLTTWVEEREIGLIHSVPSLFRAVVSHVNGGRRMPSLELMMLSGEPLLPADVRRWYAAFGAPASLVNLYGPSETTMVKLFHRVKPEDGDAARVPIGVPMRGSAALVIDDYGQACAPGAVGELYIRTPYRSLGYYRQPELTAQAFVQNPFTLDPADLIYKTGDLARIREDGVFEFLGRRDRQVKIRGIRVELDSIESALRDCEGVSNTAVVQREKDSESAYLCAYIVLRPEATISHVQRQLAALVPLHMLPEVFVPLDRLPLLPNGKLDAAALPVPDRRAVLPCSPGARTPVEEIVAGVFAQVLERSHAGREENFFALGGHSLLATKVMSRLRTALQVELPLRAIFESPTPAALAALVEEQLHGAPAAPPSRIARDRELPLSFTEQRFWFLDQLDPGQATYNSPKGVRLHGPLNVPALRAALTEIVRRHEVLRTCFPVRDGEPIQSISPPTPLPLPLLDLRCCPPAVREVIAEHVMELDAKRPFDLLQGPVLRAHLLRLDVQDHVLLLTLHHIVSDGWSVGILMRDLSALYTAASSGAPSTLDELPIQYADFAVWQRQWLSQALVEQQLEFWRTQLDGAEVLELPTDRPRPPLASTHGARLHWTLPPSISAQLHQAGQQHGVTLFMALLSAWDILLARYSGQTDITVGTEVANRRQVETEELIGSFVNQLVLRTALTGDPSFAQVLARVRETTLGAYAHQDLPFEKLVEALAPLRDLSRAPLFQVELLHQNVPRQSLTLPDLQIEPFGGRTVPARFDLTMSVEEDEAGLHGTLEYATALFDLETMARLLEHYERLLTAALSDLDCPVDMLPILGDAERRQLVVEWNQTETSWPSDAAVHEEVAAQAMRTPDAVALIHDDSQVSYGALNRQSNQLARHLRDLGVRPDVRVGLLLSRTPRLLTGLLGILKAGGAYVPIDPATPKERLAAIIHDAQIAVVVTETAFEEMLPPVTAVCMDRDEAAIAECDGADLSLPIQPETLAYVIYTSGSTGRPKGVMITHSGLSNYIHWATDAYRAADHGGSPVHTSISFDLTLTSILPTLVSGGPLILMPESGSLDALAAIGGSRPSFSLVKLTPAHLRTLANLLPASSAAAFTKLFVVGGEALPGESVPYWRTHNPDVRVVNEYGPTETVVGCCVYEVPRDAQFSGDIPIGRPIANTQLYVLDSQLEPVPAGVAGELFIGGNVARGYLNQPALTAAKFVPDPFGHRPGSRLFRTADRARWRSDGELEFLGRLDDQVKLRGYRIESGEIEAALMSHPGVRQAAIILREDVPGDARLIAYIVPGAIQPDDQSLRAHLANRLPVYMVPSAFIALEALPLTRNGKLDRRALPAPEDGNSGHRRLQVPADEIEEIVAGIWGEVLRLDRVGRDEDFFGLGGHSMLATQVIARVRAALNVELPLRTLFEAPTVAALAARIAAERHGHIAPPMIAADRERPLPLSFAQQRLWVLSQMEALSAAYNIPVALQFTGKLDKAALRAAIGEVVQRHEILRTTYQVTTGGQPVQVISAQSQPSLPVVDLAAVRTSSRDAFAKRLMRAEALRPFDLARGPVLRTTLLSLSSTESLALLTLHHIASDAWSIGVLASEISASYDAVRSGAAPQLTPLAMQYADYVVWQRQCLQGQVLDQQVSYWRHLEGAPSFLTLPEDHPRPPELTGRGASHAFSLSKELAAKLRALGRREGATLYMTLFAAWQALLSRYGAGDDIVVGTPVSGRSHIETEPLIGPFVNTLVIRTNLVGDPPLRQILGRLRDVVLQAHAHQDVPFEHLVDALGAERSLAHTPLFNVMFSFDRARAGASPRLEGVSVAAISAAAQTAKYDLQLNFEDEGDEVSGALIYRTELFNKGTIERLACHLVRMLDAFAEIPAARLSEVDLLLPSERAHLLVETNQTAQSMPREMVPALIERQAILTPDAIAVEAADGQLSYRELARRASALAHRLKIRPEATIGIAVSRGLDMVVAVLGTLQSGAAYVPLDTSYPPDRLAHTVADAGVRLILTDSHQRAQLGSLSEGRTIILLDDANATADSRAPSVVPDQLAYIIYTSGSTGRSKGVAVSHGALTNFLHAMRGLLSLDSTDRLMAVTTLSFDIAGLEIYLPLICGARVIMARREVAQSGAALAALMESRQATMLQATPATWEQLLMAGWKGQAGLQVLSGGEALRPALAAALLNGSGPVWNLYGPTETAIWSMAARLSAAPEYYMSSTSSQILVGHASACQPPLEAVSGQTPEWGIPLGAPIANTQVYVLDGNGEPVPTGVAGELYISGAGVARGYVNRPALTAERFVPDPFGPSGVRLYRTGDRVRWRSSGEMEFLGRIDHQVKLRGYRIEPGEIEAALLDHPQVKQCVVIRREDNAGDARLVAYAVAEGEAPTAEQLRRHLQGRVPDYMIPTAYEMLDSLPLTPNGKLDRRALPAPGQAPAAPCEAARTATEELLAVMWSDLLGLPHVDVTDSFFALGGHSLSAAALVARVHRAFNVELPLRAVFETPTVRDLASRVERLRNGEDSSDVPPLLPVSRRSMMPLSFAQQRLWFLHQLQPASASYNITRAVRLVGPLNVVALAASITEIVRRHEVLRSSFVLWNGEPAQSIAPSRAVSLPVVDLESCDVEPRERLARRLAAEHAARPFDLGENPPLRMQLLRLDASNHVLLLTMHHILGDAWSMQILDREVAIIYEGYCAGTGSPLADLPVQYADFAEWQRAILRGPRLEKHLAYWRKELAGLPVLELPSDRPRPAVATTRGGGWHFEIPTDVTAGLRQLSRSQNLTLFMTLLTAFQVLLARYSGQTDIAVGTPVANRTQVELEGLIGCFLNTLVLRTRWTGRATFAELLGRVRETLIEAAAHQELPFERLVDELAPARDLSRAPLFQVMFSFQNTPRHEDCISSLQMLDFPAPTQSSAFDLSLYMWEHEDRLYANIAYATDLFEPATIERLAGQFGALLASVIHAPEQPACELNMLPAVERKHLLGAVNATGAPLPAATLPELVRRQAKAAPDAIAIDTDEGQLSYAALAQRMARVAQRLHMLGVQPEEMVGVCVSRGIELVPALLGVFAAGGAYVPLDASYPAARLSYMIGNAKVRVLLSDSHEAPRIAAATPPECTIVTVDEDAPLVTESYSFASDPSAARLAYVIYTSGSTGRPKGVAVTHGGLTNFLAGIQESLHLTAADRLVAVTTISFDIAALELYLPLLCGARVILATREVASSPEALASHFSIHGASLLQATPAAWEQLLSIGWRPSADLRILSGGEALRPALAAALLERGSALWNLYGPTETTIWSLAARFTQIPPSGISIGHPLSNTQVYILDTEGALAPMGVPGELWIGGMGVARGYLREPAITAERFVPDSFGETPGARLYRTGDRVRWRADGSLEFLGRTDSQIKLRGYRIELGEVEAALNAHPLVRQSIVVARQHASGEMFLVAYVVPSEARAMVDVLQRDLGQRLPAYMVPAVFVELEAFPLTPNGKVDKHALPAPDWRTASGSAYVAPRTRSERILASIWSEVLGIDEVGVQDNFFGLGGDSILSIKVVSKANELGFTLTPRHIFEHQTVEELALASVEYELAGSASA